MNSQGNAARPIVQLRDVNKYYDDTHIVKNLSLDVMEGEFLTILGPSGSGKTTTLRMIAGFEEPSSGAVLISGRDVSDKAPYERDVNTVFQNYALFPHMDAWDNVAYGLKMKKVPKAELEQRVDEMLRLVQMSAFDERLPSQLSGGQRQRVAVARALVNRPKVLLLDEPLGALDLKLRKQMQLELKRLQRQLNITFICVTHDQEEALAMSDRIAIMHDGVLEQVGTPREIYEEPASRFAASFIGETNLLDVTVRAVRAAADPASADVELDAGGGRALVRPHGARLAQAAGHGHGARDDDAQGEPGLSAGDELCISVRPERLRLSREPVAGFTVQGVVRDRVYAGSALKLIVALPDGTEVRVQRLAGDEAPLPESGSVYLSWRPEDARILRAVG